MRQPCQLPPPGSPPSTCDVCARGCGCRRQQPRLRPLRLLRAAPRTCPGVAAEEARYAAVLAASRRGRPHPVPPRPAGRDLPGRPVHHSPRRIPTREPRPGRAGAVPPRRPRPPPAGGAGDVGVSSLPGGRRRRRPSGIDSEVDGGRRRRRHPRRHRRRSSATGPPSRRRSPTPTTPPPTPPPRGTPRPRWSAPRPPGSACSTPSPCPAAGGAPTTATTPPAARRRDTPSQKVPRHDRTPHRRAEPRRRSLRPVHDHRLPGLHAHRGPLLGVPPLRRVRAGGSVPAAGAHRPRRTARRGHPPRSGAPCPQAAHRRHPRRRHRRPLRPRHCRRPRGHLRPDPPHRRRRGGPAPVAGRVRGRRRRGRRHRRGGGPDRHGRAARLRGRPRRVAVRPRRGGTADRRHPRLEARRLHLGHRHAEGVAGGGHRRRAGPGGGVRPAGADGAGNRLRGPRRPGPADQPGPFTPGARAVDELRKRLAGLGRDADAGILRQIRSVGLRAYKGVKITREAAK
jgi:hypothetical protein